MSILAKSPYKMSWAKRESSGWAAFDLKQRQKQGLEPEVENDTFPPISGTLDSLQSCETLLNNNHVPVKSFSSVLVPSKSCPALKKNDNGQTTVLDSDSDSLLPEKNANLAIKKLKEQHCWAENGIIEDILAAVDNNVLKASTLLESMASDVKFEAQKPTSVPRSTTADISCHEKKDKSLSLGKSMDSTLADHLKDNNNDVVDRNDSSGRKVNSSLEQYVERLNSVPVEPEWEEDDVYISQRKDSLRVMRSASRHSKAATNAFLRGDHFSAQHHSTKAREEWYAAEGLNAKAAREILSIRNSKSDIWRLDLHGLHAAEAIQALQQHLQRIESQCFSKGPGSSNGHKKKDRIIHSNFASLKWLDKEKLDKQQTPSRLRSALHVITGIGNHSRGQAALPIAVRSFLNENGYRFEETRPGLITVWPKFRQS